MQINIKILFVEFRLLYKQIYIIFKD